MADLAFPRASLLFDRQWQDFFWGLYVRVGESTAPDLTDLVEKSGSITQITTRSHSDLQNLEADDHPQYVRAAVYPPVLAGSGTFGGSGGVTVSLDETLDGTNYHVTIQPTEQEPLDIGVIGVPDADKTATTFKVYNSGSDVASTFDWVLVDKNG